MYEPRDPGPGRPALLTPIGLLAIGLVLTQSSNEILWYIGLFVGVFGVGVFFTSLGRP